MDVKTAIELRKSIREYTDQEIPKEDIVEILDAARIAPSGKNQQNWHFLVMTDQAQKDALAQVVIDKNEAVITEMEKRDPEKAARYSKFYKRFTLFFKDAPLVILIYTSDMLPDGYPELQLIGTPYYELNRMYMRSPALMSLGGAMENMNLRAIELGYGMCWMTGPNIAADEIQQWVKDTFGFEKTGFFFTAMASIGVPTENQKTPKKKDLEEIVTWL